MKKQSKLIVKTTARLVTTLAVAAGAALIWEGFNHVSPPVMGSVRAWAWGIWQGMMGR